MPASILDSTREAVDDARRLQSILEEAPWIRQNFPRYDRWEATRLLAGLLTCPECHANTIRLEALVHLAVALARGRQLPRRDDLIVWFNRHFSRTHLSQMEDPLEDVFVSNVIDGSGNHRIFEGIWERNDFWLQCLINVARRLPPREEYPAMMRNVGALLDLSEALADRNGLERNIEGGGEDKQRIHLPARDDVDALADSVVFTVADLSDLGVDPANLAPFVWAETSNDALLNAELENSPLERRPLLQRGDEFLVALPTAISVAIRRFVLERVEACGDLIALDTLLNQMQADVVTKSGLAPLHGTPWDRPDFPQWDGRPPVSLTFMPFQFDRDKFGVLCMVQPPLKNAAGRGFGDFTDLSDGWEPIEAGFKRVIAHVSAAPGFRAGLWIFALGGMGVPLAMPVPDVPETWQVVSYSVPNFLMLATLRGMDLLMIWRLATQEARARSRNIRFMNPNGDFNLLGFWRANKFTLVPEDAPMGNGPVLLSPPINALLDLRKESRLRRDPHAARRENPARWIEVERKNAYSSFSKSQRMPFYVATSALRRGELAGIVEAPGMTWWIASDLAPSSARDKSLLYQVWDCVGHWLVPVAAILAGRFLPDDAVIETRLAFSELPSWQDIGAIEVPAEDVPLGWQVSPLGFVILNITETFFRTFAQATNKAEREIVATLLAAGAALLGARLSVTEIVALRDHILPLGEARYFHVTVENDASFAIAPGPPDPYFVRDEVLSEITQELGLAIAPDLRGRSTEDRGEVRRQVRTAVEHLKQQIAVKLRSLKLGTVVKRSLAVLDSLHRDHHSWNVSAAALMALNTDRAELLEEAHTQENKRTGTNMAARILIETALFTCSTDGEDVPDSTLDELLAMTQVLIRIADYDQAIRADFPAGRVTIAKSGAFKVRNEFLDSVRLAYVRTSFEEGFTEAAESYSDRFHERSNQPLPGDFAAFNIALRAEFGFDCEQFVRVGEALNRIGARQNKSMFEMRRGELAGLIAAEISVPVDQVLGFLQALRIYPRDAWDADLPDGCDVKDVFPWLFKRRFSLLRRPLIEITRDPDPLIIASPLLVRDALRYLVGSAHTGEFPPSFFHSQEMRSFQQQAVARRSKKFLRETAAVMTKAGFETRTEVKMTALGAPAVLGDIDVLAWRMRPRAEIRVLECKALRNARSTSEILSQLDQFRGEAGDLLDKHIQRMRWLGANNSALQRFLGLNSFEISGAVVTSHLVPMQFVPASQEANARCVDLGSLARQYPTAVVGLPASAARGASVGPA